jgi:hypothetical protein
MGKIKIFKVRISGISDDFDDSLPHNAKLDRKFKAYCSLEHLEYL